MVDLANYERRGDLQAPFELTKKHERTQQQCERIRDAVRCDVAPLTWEAYSARKPCPGCGLPYRDEELWEFRGAMHMTPDEHARYEAEASRFEKAHGDCHAMRHNVSGSLTIHCGKCCPSPPLSPGQVEKIGRILGGPEQPHELMRWRLRLYCGHVVERRAHYTHKTLHAAFTGSVDCPECGLDPATIINGEVIGLEGEPPGAREAVVALAPRKPTKADLEVKVRELQAELDRLRGT